MLTNYAKSTRLSFDVRKDASSFYHWRSDIVFAKLYQQEPTELPGGVILPHSTQYVRLASFSAFWKSKVTDTAELTDSDVERIAIGQLEAKIATDSLTKQYGLPPFQEVLLQSIRQPVATVPPPIGSTSATEESS